MMTPELNVLESSRSRSSSPKTLSFPLEVGKRWRFTNDWMFKPTGSTGKFHYSTWKVVAHERLSVPAGEFEAFKLMSKGNIRGVSPTGS